MKKVERFTGLLQSLRETFRYSFKLFMNRLQNFLWKTTKEINSSVKFDINSTEEVFLWLQFTKSSRANIVNIKITQRKKINRKQKRISPGNQLNKRRSGFLSYFQLVFELLQRKKRFVDLIKIVQTWFCNFSKLQFSCFVIAKSTKNFNEASSIKCALESTNVFLSLKI